MAPFFKSTAATFFWRYFLTRAGIRMEGLSLHQAITKCWTVMYVIDPSLLCKRFPLALFGSYGIGEIT